MKTVLKKSCLILIALFIEIAMCAQESDFKQKALEQFGKQNYPEAIFLLKQALSENTDDAEIYYYLGYFSHYIVYDSRTFIKEGIENFKNELKLEPRTQYPVPRTQNPVPSTQYPGTVSIEDIIFMIYLT